MSPKIKLLVSGRWALFTRPEMKVERVSYDVMTPSAARGILEAIHWKPAIRWIIEEIHVLKPIRFQSIRRNEVGSGVSTRAVQTAMRTGNIGNLALVIEDHRQQRASLVLTDVAYVICARFMLTSRAGESDNEAKHLDIFTRRALKGQCFHQPCLGTREFPAHFELIESDLPQAIDETRDLGYMLYDIDHDGNRNPMVFRAALDKGVVRVPSSGSSEIRR